MLKIAGVFVFELVATQVLDTLLPASGVEGDPER
jgi:hypothetical protein